MHFLPDPSTVPVITGHGPGWVTLPGERYTQSVLIDSNGLREPWGAERFEDLTAEHFARLAALDVEVVLFGSGERLRFPPPAWLAPMMAKRIGLETMTTDAACRTYTVLANERRRVAVALVLGTPSA